MNGLVLVVGIGGRGSWLPCSRRGASGDQTTFSAHRASTAPPPHPSSARIHLRARKCAVPKRSLLDTHGYTEASPPRRQSLRGPIQPIRRRRTRAARPPWEHVEDRRFMWGRRRYLVDFSSRNDQRTQLRARREHSVEAHQVGVGRRNQRHELPAQLGACHHEVRAPTGQRALHLVREAAILELRLSGTSSTRSDSAARRCGRAV